MSDLDDFLSEHSFAGSVLEAATGFNQGTVTSLTYLSLFLVLALFVIGCVLLRKAAVVIGDEAPDKMIKFWGSLLRSSFVFWLPAAVAYGGMGIVCNYIGDKLPLVSGSDIYNVFTGDPEPWVMLLMMSIVPLCGWVYIAFAIIVSRKRYYYKQLLKAQTQADHNNGYTAYK